MLKGILIAAPHMSLLKENLRREGLPWAEVRECTPKSLKRALESLQADSREVLCLVERDRDERTAGELGMFCIGYLNPEYKEELSDCRILIEGFEEIDRMFLEHIHTRALGLPVRIAETPRLLIREMTLEDLDDIRALHREEDTFFLTEGVSESREDEAEKIRAYIDYMYGLYQFGIWVLVEKESGKLIGRAGFGIADYLGFQEIDLGYLIDRAYRGRGYGEEAVRAVLKYAEETLGFPRVSAYTERENQISRHLLDKLGFRETETFSYQGRELCRYLLELTSPEAHGWN